MNWKTLFKDVFSLLVGIFTGFPRQMSSKTLNYFRCYNSAQEVKKILLLSKIENWNKKKKVTIISYLISGIPYISNIAVNLESAYAGDWRSPVSLSLTSWNGWSVWVPCLTSCKLTDSLWSWTAVFWRSQDTAECISLIECTIRECRELLGTLSTS